MGACPDPDSASISTSISTAQLAASASLTAPSGWTPIRRDTRDPSTLSAAAPFCQLATSSATASATFTLPGGNQMAGGIAKVGEVLVHAERQPDLPAPGGTTQRRQLWSGTGTGTLGATVGDELLAGPRVTSPRSASHGTFSTRPGGADAEPDSDRPPSTWATGHRLERIVGVRCRRRRT